jgi:hypothetical protein
VLSERIFSPSEIGVSCGLRGRMRHPASTTLAVLTAAACLPGAAFGSPLAVSTAHAQYPLLARQGDLRVYGPAGVKAKRCPAALPLPTDATAIVKRAVRLAVPHLLAQTHGVRLDVRDPVVKVDRLLGSSPRAGGCGSRALGLSLFARVRLPHVFDADLARHTFAVARIRPGWVLWWQVK